MGRTTVVCLNVKPKTVKSGEMFHIMKTEDSMLIKGLGYFPTTDSILKTNFYCLKKNTFSLSDGTVLKLKQIMCHQIQ